MSAPILPPRIRNVIQAHATDHHTTVEEILSSSQMKHTSMARRHACHSLKRMGFSEPEIGRFLRKDHSTVHYALTQPLLNLEGKVVGAPLRPQHRPADVPVPDLSGEWAV
jgi:hypothetical protein